MRFRSPEAIPHGVLGMGQEGLSGKGRGPFFCSTIPGGEDTRSSQQVPISGRGGGWRGGKLMHSLQFDITKMQLCY